MAQMRGIVKAAWITGILLFFGTVVTLFVNRSGSAKVNLNNPTFNAPAQVGDNNTQNISELPKQRKVTEADVKFITANVGDSIKTIYIMRRVSDAETYNYSKSIVDAHKTKGFKADLGNVALDGPERTYPNDPERNEKAKHIFQFDTAGTQINIYVPLHE